MAMKQLHVVKLKGEERDELIHYLRKGKSSARSQTLAWILLLADEGHEDDEITKALKKSSIESIPWMAEVNGRCRWRTKEIKTYPFAK